MDQLHNYSLYFLSWLGPEPLFDEGMNIYLKQLKFLNYLFE